MTWPLLSNGLSEVGYLSTVSVRGPTRLTKVAMVRAIRSRSVNAIFPQLGLRPSQTLTLFTVVEALYDY